MCSLRQSARVGSRDGVKKRNPVTPLLEAIEYQHSERISELLNNSEPLAKDELDDALIKASAKGDLAACQLLLTAGADPSTQENLDKVDDRYACSPAFSAAHAQYQEWLERSTALGGTALHAAIEGRHVAVLRLLLQSGAGVGLVDYCGMTPLMLAAVRPGNENTVGMLLAVEGCNVEAVDKKYGRSALHFAAGSGDAKMVEALLLAGSDIDAKDTDHNTPLMLAALRPGYHDPSWPARDTVGCLELLLERGCFINLVNKHSQTALHAAVESHDPGAVRTLLHYDAAVPPELLHQVCLVHMDSAVLKAMVKYGRRIKPELYLCVLVCVICQHSSLWRVDNKGQAARAHDVARELIRGIPDLGIVDELFNRSDEDLKRLFQEDDDAAIEQIISDLEALGLLGLALKHGKYGVAKMLHFAGCTARQLQGPHQRSVLTKLSRHWTLRPWLSAAVSEPRSLKRLCRPLVRVHWGCDIAGMIPNLPDEVECVGRFLSMSDLEDVPVYDRGVQEQEELLLDECYTDREVAKAAYQQTIWIYSQH